MAKDKKQLKHRYDEIQKQIINSGYDKEVINSMRSYVNNTLSQGGTLDDSAGTVVKLLAEQFIIRQQWAELDVKEQKNNAAKQKEEKAQPQEEKGFWAWLKNLGRKIKSWFTSSEKKKEAPEAAKKSVKSQKSKEKNGKAHKKTGAEKQISSELSPKEKWQLEMQIRYCIETAGKKLSLNIQSCNDVKELIEYEALIKEEYGENSYEYMYISERTAAAMKFNNLEKNRGSNRFTRPESTVSENGVMLAKNHTGEKQTTPYGCWGAVLSNMLRCYNVNVTQEQVRGFRPEYNKPESSQGYNNIINLNKRLNSGSMNEIVDVADIVHRTIPDAALHHISIASNENSYSRDIIEQNKKLLKETVYNAIAKDKAPVAMLLNDHYVTVIGVVDDKFVIENPLSENSTSLISVDYVFEKSKTKGAVTIDWIEQLEFSQDGRCPKIEKEWADKAQKIECKDGHFVPEEGVPYASHYRGNLYSDVSRVADCGVEEYIYLPKMSYEKECAAKGAKFGESFKMNDNESYEEYSAKANVKKPVMEKEQPGETDVEKENEFSIF